MVKYHSKAESVDCFTLYRHLDSTQKRTVKDVPPHTINQSQSRYVGQYQPIRGSQ